MIGRDLGHRGIECSRYHPPSLFFLLEAANASRHLERVERHLRARGERHPAPSTPCPLAKTPRPRRRSRMPALGCAHPSRACGRGTGSEASPTPSSTTRQGESWPVWTRARSRVAWLWRGTACSSCSGSRTSGRRRGRKTSSDTPPTSPMLTRAPPPSRPRRQKSQERNLHAAKPWWCLRSLPGWIFWSRFWRATRAPRWLCPCARPTPPAPPSGSPRSAWR